MGDRTGINKHRALPNGMAALALGLLLTMAASGAWALNASKNLAVSLIVPNPVKISATAMGFGSGFGNTALQATATIAITMGAGQPYQISINAGMYKRIERRMSDGANHFINYRLYKDAARTQQWGDSDYAATFAAGSSQQATGNGGNQVFTLYGLVPAMLPPPPTGRYHDTVTVTIHY